MTMKITINIDKNLPENLGNFELREMSPEISHLIGQLQNMNFMLIATKDEKKYQLDLAKITTIYAASKKVYVIMDDKEEFAVKFTLADLSERLSTNFLRISNAEIINANKISHFEFTFGGKIKINFKNGGFTYSSRAYLKDFKRYFGL